jgi:hypothetical protein
VILLSISGFLGLLEHEKIVNSYSYHVPAFASGVALF